MLKTNKIVLIGAQNMVQSLNSTVFNIIWLKSFHLYQQVASTWTTNTAYTAAACTTEKGKAIANAQRCLLKICLIFLENAF